MKTSKPTNTNKSTPAGYDRWGKIGVKVISKPTEPRKKER